MTLKQSIAIKQRYIVTDAKREFPTGRAALRYIGR